LTSRLPWTKFQDFYLRLGFLKVLAAALSSERRSATNDSVVRRLERPLFDSVSVHPALAERTANLFASSYPRKTSSGKQIDCPEVAEALIAAGPGGSALYGITRDTAYKILDWGHDVELVGRANQITERGLLLKSLLPRDRTDQFLTGDVAAWDPFQLDLRERLFFTFHLLETDLLTVELVGDLGALAPEKVLETRDAARMTCAALFRILKASEKTTESRDIPAYRVALDLALTMADEVDADVPPGWANHARQIRVSRSHKSAGRRALKAHGHNRPPRKTTKNADHQTIPRFEQLVDLGFVTKPKTDGESEVSDLAARRRWRYVPTEACRQWSHATRTGVQPWSSFATVAVGAFHRKAQKPGVAIQTQTVGERLWAAYSAVGRSVGLSPVDSVALRAMLDAASEGVPLEMETVHQFLLMIKERNILTDCVFFASGNSLDKMFIRLKPTFPQRLVEALGELPSEITK